MILPKELTDTPQWIVWRDEEGRKVPYQTTGGRASTSNRAHWSTYNEARVALESGNYTGLGFVFSKDDPFIGIDIDNCFDADTAFKPWSMWLVDDFCYRTYSEISPSGRGLKIFAKGKLPSERGKRTEVGDGAVEMYDHGRYFTVTGDDFDVDVNAVVDCQVQIDQWFPRLFAATASETQGTVADLDVDDVSRERMGELQSLLDTLPDSIEGSQGSDAIIRAMCDIRRMKLNAEQSWELIEWFNEHKCYPPWPREELERKWEYGAKLMQPVLLAEQAFPDDLPPLDDIRVATEPPAFSFGEMRGDEFYHKEFHVDWIVDRVLAQGDMQVVGGPTKTLKTGLSLDLTVSIAAGVPFLGEFEVLKSGPVVFCSGESGEARLHENYRTMCDYKGIEPPRDFIIAPKVPRMNSREQCDALAELIRKYGAIYCMVDPAYLSIGAGLGADGMKDVNRAGMMLARFNSLGHNQRCTMALCHHYTKAAARNRKRSLSHVNLSGAGYAEFCRQWLVLERSREYRHDGRHEILIAVGGSAGQSGEYEVVINEGFDRERRRAGGVWEVEVSDRSENPFDVQIDFEGKTGHEEAVLSAIERLDKEGRPATQNSISALARLSGRNTKACLRGLIDRGQLKQESKTIRGVKRDVYVLPEAALPQGSGGEASAMASQTVVSKTDRQENLLTVHIDAPCHDSAANFPYSHP